MSIANPETMQMSLERYNPNIVLALATGLHRMDTWYAGDQ